MTTRSTLGPEYGYVHWSCPGAIVAGVPAPYLRPVSDEASAPVISEHALSSPPAAAAGAVDAVDGGADGGALALADAATDVTGLAEAALAEADALADGAAEMFGLSESAWVSVAGGLLAAAGAPDFALLLHADAPKARTTMVAVATRALGRIATPNSAEGQVPPCSKLRRSP